MTQDDNDKTSSHYGQLATHNHLPVLYSHPKKLKLLVKQFKSLT